MTTPIIVIAVMLVVVVILPIVVTVLIDKGCDKRPHIELIKFMAVKPLRESLVANGTEHFHTIFGLGEGACGKTVSSLEVDDTATEMAITQRHSDGTKKVFVYKKTDIIGRVEIQYSEVK